jgi:hypothetical protein
LALAVMAALPEIMTALMGLIPYLVLSHQLAVVVENTQPVVQTENLVVLAAVFLVLMQVFKLVVQEIHHLHLRHKVTTEVVDITLITSPELAVVVLVP